MGAVPCERGGLTVESGGLSSPWGGEGSWRPVAPMEWERPDGESGVDCGILGGLLVDGAPSGGEASGVAAGGAPSGAVGGGGAVCNGTLCAQPSAISVSNAVALPAAAPSSVSGAIDGAPGGGEVVGMVGRRPSGSFRVGADAHRASAACWAFCFALLLAACRIASSAIANFSVDDNCGGDAPGTVPKFACVSALFFCLRGAGDCVSCPAAPRGRLRVAATLES